MLSGGSPKASPWYEGGLQRRDPKLRPPTFEPDLFRARFTLLRRADHLSEARQAHLDRLFDAHPRPANRVGRAPRPLPAVSGRRPRPGRPGPNQAGRVAGLYATGQIPEYHDTVDTIIAWRAQIVAYPGSRRVSNGPLEGINNLLQVLRRVAHGFTNYDNYAAWGILVT